MSPPKVTPQISDVDSASKSTWQHLQKIPGVAGLYRHDVSGIYHLQLTSKQRKVRKSLKTTDRKTAERKLAVYKTHLAKTDLKKGSVSLSSLVDSYLETLGAKAPSTIRNQKCVLNRLLETWPHGRNHKVISITGGNLDKWLSNQFGKLRPRSYNTYSGFIKSLLDHAVALKVIGANPYQEARVGGDCSECDGRDLAGVTKGEGRAAEDLKLIANPRLVGTMLPCW